MLKLMYIYKKSAEVLPPVISDVEDVWQAV